MPLLERKRALFLCSATLFMASVGFSLSVLATLLSLVASSYFWSHTRPQPRVYALPQQDRSHAAAASTPSTSDPNPTPSSPARPESTDSNNAPRASAPNSDPSPARPSRKSKSRSKSRTPRRAATAITIDTSPLPELHALTRLDTVQTHQRDVLLRRSQSHMQQQIQQRPRHAQEMERALPEIPSIAVSPAPAHAKFLVEEPRSSDEQTLVDGDTNNSAPAVLPLDQSEQQQQQSTDADRGRRRSRLRLSRLVQMFVPKDKKDGEGSSKRPRDRGHSKPDPIRRYSLPPPPLPTNASPVSSPSSQTSELPPESGSAKSPSDPEREKRPVAAKPRAPSTKSRSLMLRVSSDPGLRTNTEDVLDMVPASGSLLLSPTSPISTSPTSTITPAHSDGESDGPGAARPRRKHQCKPSTQPPSPPQPRPRTQPYAAPYFIPPPDTFGIEEPLSAASLSREREIRAQQRRTPSRSRTMPPESVLESTRTSPSRRTSALGLEVVNADDLIIRAS
uniref:Uncharacterized protein n=1 Tax=Mycena chlorophos TaxID=658473 RepID=A0ABQ0LXG8_MYCCL|nr:predicted protein [Mycena chlorophos]